MGGKEDKREKSFWQISFDYLFTVNESIMTMGS